MDISTLFGSMPGAVAQGLIWGIMAVGVYITYKILDIADLTVDGSICTGGAVCVMMVLSGHSLPVAMLAAVGAGMLAGLVTGLFHTFMGIPAILAGILTQLSLYSVNLKIMGKANQSLYVRNYDLLVSLQYLNKNAKFTNGSAVPWFWNPILVVGVFVALIIALLYWFFGTEWGSAMRATGSNPAMARAQGTNTNFNKVCALMLSNGIVALSGAILTQYQGFADVQMGRGAIVIGLAAVIIGEAVFGRFFTQMYMKLISVAVGGVVYYIVYQTVIWFGIDTDLLKMLSAIVVAIFLAAPYWKKKLSEKRVMLGGKKHAGA